MFIRRLRATGVRNLAEVDVSFPTGLSLFIGANGSGKSSILEAIHLLGTGRSFRADRLSKVATHGSRELLIVGELADSSGQTSTLGVQWRAPNEFRARLNGETVQSTSILARQLGVVAIVPDCSTLLTGEPAGRRRFLDQGVFHVEPQALQVQLSYRRLLQQRTAALWQDERALEAFEEQLARDGELIHASRRAFVDQLRPLVDEATASLHMEGQVDLELRSGWDPSLSLREALNASRTQDREQGYTRPGVHRAELVIRREGHRVTESLSRGELKLLAYALTLAKVRLVANCGRVPTVLIDDLGAELDPEHQQQVVQCMVATPSQCFLTLIGPASEQLIRSVNQVFHVEHGHITSMSA